MKKYLFAITCSFILLSCSASLPPYIEIKSQEEMTLNYQEFCRLLELYNPNFDILEINWDSLKSTYNTKIKSTSSEREFVQNLREMLATFQDPHCSLITPNDNSLFSEMLFHSKGRSQLNIDTIMANYGSFPFRFTIVDNAPMVSFIDSVSNEFKSGLRIGMKLVTINGQNLKDYTKSNFIYSYRTESRNALLINSHLFFGVDGQKKDLGFSSDNGDRLNLLCEYAKKNNKYFYNPIIEKYVSNLKKLTTLEYGSIKGEIGYINIPTFVGEYAPSRRRTLLNIFKFDINQNVKEFETAIKELSKTKGIIIDVRDNRGGDETISHAIISYLISDTTLFYIGRYRDKTYPNEISRLSTFYPASLLPFSEHHKKEFYMQYDGEFLNPIIVLQNEGSLSTTETFLSGMKHIPTATTLGVTSAGSSSNPDFYPLPNGLIVRIPRRQTYWDVDKMIERDGVPPDIEIHMGKNDLLLGRDTQLEKAIELMNK